MELAKLLNIIQKHIPIKESLEKPSGKIIILLRANILHLELEGLSLRLISDAGFIAQSAGSLIQALSEIALKLGWVHLAEKALNLYKMVSNTLHMFTDKAPRLRLEDAHLWPITKTLFQFELTILPDFIWDNKVHGYTEMFWVMLENDGQILHHQYFMLKKHYTGVRHTLNFKVAVNEPIPPHYLIRVVSERWPECQSLLSVPSIYLILPYEDYHVTVPSELFDLPVTELHEALYESFYQDFKYFNHVQTQVFSALYKNDANVFIAAPPGSGKTVCAELAILRNHKKRHVQLMCVVYIAPVEALAEERYHYWKKRFEYVLGVNVVKLIGERATDIELFKSANIIISTPEKWDVLSKFWEGSSLVKKVSLFIVDNLHLLGGCGGHILELILLRMAAISRAQYPRKKLRIVAFSTSVANARDLVEILDATKDRYVHIFDFPLCARPMPLDIQIESVDIANFEARMEAMVKTTYSAVAQHAKNGKPAMVFVPTTKHVIQTAMDLCMYSSADNTFLLRPTKQSQHSLIKKISDKLLKAHLSEGIAYLYEGMNREDQDIVVELFESGCVQVCILSNYMCWGVPLSAHLVIVMGTQFFDGPINAQTDYPVTDILQMTGHAGCPLVDDHGKCVILCHAACKENYKKFLSEKFPVESCLQDYSIIQNYINSEIVTKSVKSRENVVALLEGTFMITRHIMNPSFYDLLHPTHLFDRVKEFVGSTLNHLLHNAFIRVDSDDEIDTDDVADVSFNPLIPGVIASNCNVDCETIMMFVMRLNPETTLKDLLEIVCSATEFTQLPTRYGEEEMVRRLTDQQRFSFADPPNVTDPKAKAYALLQAHFSRHSVDGYLELDQREVLLIAHKLLSTIIYMTGTRGWFNLTHLAVQVSQLVTQGMWQDGSLLLQVPHFTEHIAKKWKENAGIETIYDLLGMQVERAKFLSLSDLQLLDVVKFINRFPVLNLLSEVLDSDSVHAEEDIKVKIILERDRGMIEVSDINIDTVGVRYPKAKEISWWLFVVETGTDLLLDFHRVYVTKKMELNMKFEAPEEAGKKSYTVYAMSDSYLGCDKIYDFTVNVL